jgi:hypothetical protein
MLNLAPLRRFLRGVGVLCSPNDRPQRAKAAAPAAEQRDWQARKVHRPASAAGAPQCPQPLPGAQSPCTSSPRSDAIGGSPQPCRSVIGSLSSAFRRETSWASLERGAGRRRAGALHARAQGVALHARESRAARPGLDPTRPRQRRRGRVSEGSHDGGRSHPIHSRDARAAIPRARAGPQFAAGIKWNRHSWRAAAVTDGSRRLVSWSRADGRSTPTLGTTASAGARMERRRGVLVAIGRAVCGLRITRGSRRHRTSSGPGGGLPPDRRRDDSYDLDA